MTAQSQQALSGKARGWRSVYAIFEGGGAKGITHIGALKALEKERLELVGVAGTSAGAIIAALAAVGYKADDLFAEDGSTDILKKRKCGPLDLLGTRDWRRFKRLGRAASLSLLFLLLAVAASIAAARTDDVATRLIALGLALLFAAALLYSLRPLFWAARRILGHHGLFSTDAMRDTLNEVLRDKLKDHYRELGRGDKVPKLVRFKHIDPTILPGCCRLKIVVSDARSGKLVLFDHHDGEAVIADVVAASASIPFAFEPREIDGAAHDDEPVFVDGGLVSNLPAWSFRTEKRGLEREQGGAPIPVIAFTLTSAKSAAAARRSLLRFREVWAFVKDVIWTGIFGSQAVVQDFVSDLLVIELSSPLDTLDFDCSRTAAIAAYRAGLDQAEARLREQRTTAELTTRALEGILQTASDLIEARRNGDAKPMPHLRASLVDPVSGRLGELLPSALRVVASANMDNDADDRMEFDPRNEVAPRALRERRPVYADVEGWAANQFWMTKYEHALVRAGVCSAICLPIFARATPAGASPPPPQRVLCLDSSDRLQGEFNDTSFMEALIKASTTVSRTLIDDLIKG